MVEHIRRTTLVGSALERAEVSTIRLCLFRIGALVQKTVRRIVVRIASSFLGQDLFLRVAAQLGRCRHVLDTS